MEQFISFIWYVSLFCTCTYHYLWLAKKYVFLTTVDKMGVNGKIGFVLQIFKT